MGIALTKQSIDLGIVTSNGPAMLAFYHDLLGMKVVTAAEGEIGTIAEVYDAPAGPLLSVTRAEGKELLIPFVRETVRRLDAAEKVLELEVPPGLLDL